MFAHDIIILAYSAAAGAAAHPYIGSTSSVPDYFQTSPQIWAGPTATGKAPFLAQTDVATAPSTPLQTGVPIIGNSQNQSIFEHMGYLSPYFPNPSGFGIDEYPLPDGAKIVQVQMLSRHGARYPTLGADVFHLGDKIKNNSGNFKATGPLTFLNDWEFQLGHEILVPRGRQELFESGVNHYYRYGQLYNPNSKIIVRTTTQDRMLKSCEYFLSGFFGLEWTNNATIEVIIEWGGFNNSLAGYMNCPNGLKVKSGAEAQSTFVHEYLQNATARLQSMISGLDWTIEDTFAAQNMCPYETVAYGYSAFCNLFSYDEWENYEYTSDLSFAGGSGFQAPTSRAIGLGYVQEVVARLENHTLGYSGSQINTTLDNNTSTFPLDQSLYFDFSHDTNIMAILTAFGLTQFADFLPPTIAGAKTPHNLTVSHLEPFGARLDIEIIKTPKPVGADRVYVDGEQATYLHFILNQRSLPLGASHPECGADRLDGWCELGTFLEVMKKQMELADFDYACFGDYEIPAYGGITNGAPPRR